jgi:DnaA family protein
MISQLTLGVGLKDEATFANFHAGQNAALIKELKKVAEGHGVHSPIYIAGNGAQGLSHLLQATCHEAYSKKLTAVYIPFENINDYSTHLLEGMESFDIICIDDAQKIAGNAEWEEAFFHAFNRMHDAGKQIIIAANRLPKLIGIQLPDLVSRLSWGMVFSLQALSDAEKLETLIMRAQRRGMTLTEEVGKYILNHCPRHMATLFAALEALDKASLAAQRKLTIPFIKSILEI